MTATVKKTLRLCELVGWNGKVRYRYLRPLYKLPWEDPVHQNLGIKILLI